MAILKIINENKTLTNGQAIAEYLETFGIRYEQWTPAQPVEPRSPAEGVLKAYAGEIDKLKALGG